MLQVEAVTFPTNNAKGVLKFLKKHIFTCFGAPRAIVNDSGTHFCDNQFQSLLKKYGVRHKVELAYHPQTNGKAKVSNREIKKILEKTLESIEGERFKVNGQRLKHYWGGELDREAVTLPLFDSS
ncbi:uncharacterized protein LOC129302770 [Prosopis cineraria]|uniref:uncharacterized protein LOC129302770 n=1 Tax=Prosopis cineraria TaxID=364024 RepID=UPI0024106307|nr:uncharacterized protein LOC129302770 [Prosopis cineraria]